MKAFIKTILFLSLAFTAAITGAWINHGIIQNNEISSILKEIQNSLDLYKRDFDPSKKTVFVIGRSTAIYSFDDNKENYDIYSFVDKLKNNFNVLNLVNINLFNFKQAHAVLDFADSNVKNPDLVVIENPVYMTDDEFIDGGNDFILWASCLKNENKSEACRNFNPFFRQKEKIKIVINPCAKKYQEELRISYLKLPNERRKVIKKVMDCGKNFNSEKEVELLLSDAFRFGFAQNLSFVANSQLSPGAGNLKNKTPNFRNHQGPEIISYVDLLFINKYMRDILNEYDWKKIIFVPHHAKEVSKVKELPVFQSNKNRIYFLDLTNELRSSPRTFAENFPDGSHSHFWFQDLIAEKIYEISKKK